MRRLIGEVFRTRVLAGPVSLASAFKLSLSGFNKGLVARFLEMVAASHAIGQEEA